MLAVESCTCVERGGAFSSQPTGRACSVSVGGRKPASCSACSKPGQLGLTWPHHEFFYVCVAGAAAHHLARQRPCRVVGCGVVCGVGLG